MIHEETNPLNARRLIQFCGREAVVVNPPALAVFARRKSIGFTIFHLCVARIQATVAARFPRMEVIQDFDSNHARLFRRLFVLFHYGDPRRSELFKVGAKQSILREIRRMAERSRLHRGTISDIGGPTANMYRHELYEARSIGPQMSTS